MLKKRLFLNMTSPSWFIWALKRTEPLHGLARNLRHC